MSIMHTETQTVEGLQYRIEYMHDGDVGNPLEDAASDGFGVYVITDHDSTNSNHLAHCGRAGEVLQHYANKYSDPEKVATLWRRWRAMGNAPEWVLVTGHDHGYTQGDYHRWYALVDVAHGWGDGDSYTLRQLDTAISYVQGVMSEFTAWRYGDTFGWQVYGPDGEPITDAEQGGCFGDPSDTDGYWRSDITDHINRHFEAQRHAANMVGAGFVGVI